VGLSWSRRWLQRLGLITAHGWWCDDGGVEIEHGLLVSGQKSMIVAAERNGGESGKMAGLGGDFGEQRRCSELGPVRLILR
jgi:hypothetical protein